jgi:hypothetical protein
MMNSDCLPHQVLEMLVVMYRSEARRGARWWVVCDDDSFVFVERLVRVLSMLNASEPLLVGGGRGQAHLCGHGLCHYHNWTEQHGHPRSSRTMRAAQRTCSATRPSSSDGL